MLGKVKIKKREPEAKWMNLITVVTNALLKDLKARAGSNHSGGLLKAHNQPC